MFMEKQIWNDFTGGIDVQWLWSWRNKSAVTIFKKKWILS